VWATCIAQDVEELIGDAATPVRILAVDDPRLVRMKRKAPLRETLRPRVRQGPRWLLAPTMAADIVSVALEGDVGVLFRHPPIECLMQKHECPQGTDHGPLRRSRIPRYHRPIRQAHWHLEPARDIEQHRCAIGVSASRSYQ
jgi:hypothetical protein